MAVGSAIFLWRRRKLNNPLSANGVSGVEDFQTYSETDDLDDIDDDIDDVIEQPNPELCHTDVYEEDEEVDEYFTPL